PSELLDNKERDAKLDIESSRSAG
ncbi:hypothetical protein Tco_1020886, partial [Tanacetum coccineum]